MPGIMMFFHSVLLCVNGLFFFLLSYGSVQVQVIQVHFSAMQCMWL